MQTNNVLVQAFCTTDGIRHHAEDIVVLYGDSLLNGIPKNIICSATFLSVEFPTILNEIMERNRYHDCMGFIFKNLPTNNKYNNGNKFSQLKKYYANNPSINIGYDNAKE